MSFNPNELILERIRTTEEYDPVTDMLVGRYTQCEEASLQTSAEGTDVTNAIGSPVKTFYRNPKGTYTFTNSFFSADLLASQWGTTKEVASESKKMQMPVSQIIKVTGDSAFTLKYVPVAGSLKYVRVFDEDNNFGDIYILDTAADAEKKSFSLSDKTITMPAEFTGRVFVSYIRETTEAVSVTKTNDSLPEIRKLVLHAVFHDPCKPNVKYAGTILIKRAQIDPSAIDIALKADGKHPASYIIMPDPCAEDGEPMITVMVAKE